MPTTKPSSQGPQQGASNGGSTQSIAVLEPAVQQMLDQIAAEGGPPLYKLSPGEAREVLLKLQRSAPDKPRANVEDTSFAVGPTGTTKVRIVRPEGATGALPAVMWFRGGGWVLGDAETHDRLTREFANGVGAAVIFVDYEHSPEARFPVALEQCYEATRYVAEHAGALGIDSARLAVAGDSVGGNLATVVCLLAKERGGPKIGFQLLYYPVTDASMSQRSYQSFKDGPWLTAKAMQWFWDAYMPDEKARKNYKLSPIEASIDQLRGLPEALIVVDENDVLRDEGEAYARKLLQAGVRVTSTRYNGTIHDFVLLNPIARTQAAREATRQGIDALRRVLRH